MLKERLSKCFYEIVNNQLMKKDRDIQEHMQKRILVFIRMEMKKIDDPDWEEDITMRGKHYRAKKSSNKVNITIDKDSFLDNIAFIADKTFTSSRNAVQIAAASLSTAGESEKDKISRLTISHRTLHRKRDKLRLSSDKLIT